MEDLPEGVYPPAPPMPEPTPAKVSRWRRQIDLRPWAIGAGIGALGHLTSSGFALTMGAVAIVALASYCYGQVDPSRRAHWAAQERYHRANEAADSAWTTYTEARRKLEDRTREYQDLIDQKRAANAEHNDALMAARIEAVERISNIEDARRARLATAKETWRTAQTVYAITQARRAILRLRMWDLADRHGIARAEIEQIWADCEIEYLESKETPV